MSDSSPSTAWPNRPARIILLLLLGAVIGVAGTIGFLDLRRARAIRALPSLADRDHAPVVDELTSITLVRRGGQLDLLTRDPMGGPRGTTRAELEAWLAIERKFSESDWEPIVSVSFDPGVTMEDLNSTLEYLHSIGVNRYFIGYR